MKFPNKLTRALDGMIAELNPKIMAAVHENERLSAEAEEADQKAFAVAKEKGDALMKEFHFDDAKRAYLEPELKQADRIEQQKGAAKKAQWLASFKSNLVKDFTRFRYTGLLKSSAGAIINGTIVKADDQQIQIKTVRGVGPDQVDRPFAGKCLRCRGILHQPGHAARDRLVPKMAARSVRLHHRQEGGGEEALERSRGVAPDLSIGTVHVPGDGWQVSRIAGACDLLETDTQEHAKERLRQFPTFHRLGKQEWIVALVLWVILTCFSISYSYALGKLSMPIGWDDTVYLNDAYTRLQTFYKEGLGGVLKEYVRNTPHSPLSSALALASFCVIRSP